MNEARKQLVAGLKSKLVVSCQAYPGEPMRRADITAAVAQSVVAGGASAVRVQGLADIIAVRQAVEVPIIGLIKAGHDGVYITPSVAHAKACIEAGADIVAVDATLRERGAGETFADAVAAIHDCFPQAAVMADCASLEDAKAAEDAGADLIGTTLAGYTPDSYAYSRPATEGPDLRFIEALCLAVNAPVVVEGRIHSPEDLRQVYEFPIHFACVGTAITHPQRITGWYTKMLP
ncbi:N-acetylmannosamine-6-phosphate 2-epimerase [Mobiluncus mulieris]|uniref:N-acylglucosamine-6-phosphate 2-epimerase n=1 Tax=Mobiluncus mulieris TaxID=2052 RepID=A0ABD4TY86_9ACTO|nr:N-acetylmannosamine-6-phosphate 2-epimerase [Mobiluncus mulieris]MCU9969846.1 N-acetylmannosamine-6-phosphate 2-epimerase [Mobiluncus mulieris]MCU9974294.1 N-acetylmannosamine-6-phosphate 2-epimerase [Mobiluncus mulieris]MCU9997389.1 N-acetylmannosamine-6-phosphate 2-epimerase [Mobiluncus mulieris]MCV0010348.1 N-acetylmannosamine-6-phosphate 2-epimerase [Mobiluncus mulieris]NMW61616.1 N-acetylmannosamine-6-phosphate 2-epimerase [Mobiluncus mulieris]